MRKAIKKFFNFFKKEDNITINIDGSKLLHYLEFSNRNGKLNMKNNKAKNNE